MALREEVLLSIQRAQQQINQLQNQLANLSTTINVPVDVQGEEAIVQLQSQLDAADETVDVRVNTQGIAGAESQFRSLSGEIDDTEGELRQAQVQADRLGDELDTTGTRGVQAFGGLRSAIGPLVATFAAGLGLSGVVRGFNQAIDSATALTESINAVNVIFGEGGQVIQEFGETSASSVGLAASQVNQLVTPIGALLQNFGLEGREAADAALELTTRAADLASVFNTDVNEALEAIGSALRGEQEPIRRFGVNLNAAAADARALELGLVDVGEEVSIAARGQANYSLLLEQTAFAAGDFTNTADSAANRQRILTAAFEDARAELGEALLPAFEALLEIAPQLIESLAELGPTFASGADSAAAFFESLEPITSNLPQIVEGFGLLSDLGGLARAGVNQTAEAIGSLTQARLDDFVTNLGEARDILVDFQDQGVRRVISIDFLNSLEEGEDNSEAFAAALEDLFNASEGVLDVDTVEEFAAAAGIADEAAAELVQDLLLQARAAGASASQIRVLEQVLRAFGGIQPTFDGALVDFDFGATQQNLAATTGAVEGADRALLNLASGVDEVADSQLPVIVRDFEDLAIAAEDAGVDVLTFVNNLPDEITLNLSGPELEVLSLIETLDGLETRLAELNEGQFANIELPELEFDSEGAVTNLDEVIAAIVEQAGEDATIEANLAEIIIGADSIDTAAFVDSLEPEVRAALAEAFALDEGAAQEVQSALDGSMEGLGEGASAQLAETMRTANPEQLVALGTFAEKNFVSQVVREQIGTTAGVIAGILSEGIASSPELVLDMVDAEIGDLTTPAQTIAQKLSDLISSNIRLDPSLFGTEGTQGAPSTGTGTGGNPPPPPPVQVVIQNATTEDITTSATQAAQTVGAVSSLLPRAQ